MRRTTPLRFFSSAIRAGLFALVGLSAAVLSTGCPDREEAIDAVGGAPGRQVEDARVRINAAEQKMLDNAEKAAAVAAPEE